MGADDDDVDFTAVMQREGVAPVITKPARVESGGRGPGMVASKTGSAERPASARAVPQAGRPVSTRPAVESPASKVSAELVAARAELRARQQEREGLLAERDELAARVKLLVQERDAAVAAVAAVADAATATRRSEAAARRPLPEPVGVPTISLAEALVVRGVTDPAEQARAVAALVGTQSAARLVAMLETRERADLRSALERRLALVCGGPGCVAPAGAAAIEVSPARCEICGGSEIQRAATRFIRACEAAGIVRVRFVGGSPNYRTQLEALFPRGGPLSVRTTAGDRRVPLSRSKAQQRSDDLVIVWGATELDHATSGAYRAQFGRVETIAHRGIGRMLDLASERIAVG